MQDATAAIVEQCLKDLGYQVGEVSQTHFVEGGVVHFRRPGRGRLPGARARFVGEDFPERGLRLYYSRYP